MQCKISFIGAGNMAGAIINGIIHANLLEPAQIGVFDINETQLVNYKNCGFATFFSIAELLENSEYVVLAVKPQAFQDVLEEISHAEYAENTVIVSIAAGVSIEYIKRQLGEQTRVIRVMPNTPLIIGSGSTALAREQPVSDEQFAFVRNVFSGAGMTAEIHSEQMNAVIPLNGSSPAYIYLFAKIFVEQAVKAGFDAETANQLFCNTLIGSARMMLESGKSYQQLIDMVTSPKGTTFEGLAALEQNHFETALIDCFNATVRRAQELGQ